MKAGIAIDKWKLPIFTRHLKEAGFSYEQAPGVTDDTYMLYVHTDEPARLSEVCKAAMKEAQRTGKPK